MEEDVGRIALLVRIDDQPIFNKHRAVELSRSHVICPVGPLVQDFELVLYDKVTNSCSIRHRSFRKLRLSLKESELTSPNPRVSGG